LKKNVKDFILTVTQYFKCTLCVFRMPTWKAAEFILFTCVT